MTTYEHGSEESDLQGLAQFTLALAAPKGAEQPESESIDALSGTFPDSPDADAIREGLERKFASRGFRLEPITELTPSGAPAHSWLGPLSRHVPLSIGDAFKTANSPDFPLLLRWHGRSPVDNPADPYLRAQTVQNMTGLPPAAAMTTCNDYLLGEITSDPLGQLRWFFARLYAQRRNMIFASQLAERMYHVWFPPALLTPLGSADESRLQLALLPVASITRQSYSRSWRHTGAVTLLLVPVRNVGGADAVQSDTDPKAAGAAQGSSRRSTCEELGSLVDSLKGSSFVAPHREATRYEHAAGDLWGYLTEVGERCVVTDMVMKEAGKNQRGRPTGTIRQWCELIATAAGERLWEWSGTQLPDEVLRAMRVNACWSVLAVIDGGKMEFPPQQDPTPGWKIDEDVAEPIVLPTVINRLLARLRGSKDLFLPRPSISRIDDLSTMEGTYLTWHVPGRRGIVTAYAVDHESFPGESSLHLFGFLGHALLAAAYSAATVDALNREPPEPQSVVRFATKAHSLANELDEMFDLDIVSVQFQVMWRRLRRALGIDEQYELARERLELLAHYSEVIDQGARENLAERVALMTAVGGALAAIVGVGILIFSVGLIVREVWQNAGVAVIIWCSSIFFLATVFFVGLTIYLYRNWGPGARRTS